MGSFLTRIAAGVCIVVISTVIIDKMRGQFEIGPR